MRLPCSVIVVVLNAIELIRDSVSTMTELGVSEVIYVDGGSDDGTVEFLRGAPEVTLLEMPGTGIIERLLAGISEAEQELVLIACDDDIINRADLDQMLQLLESAPELDGAQFRIMALGKSWWEKSWGAYFQVTTRQGQSIPLLGRPCLTRKANYLGLPKPPDAFADDTWIHLQQVSEDKVYEVGPGITFRSCPNNARWNLEKFRNYGLADNQISASMAEHFKLLFHTGVRIPVFRSVLAVIQGNAISLPFFVIMGAVRSYHHLCSWFSSRKREV